MNIQVEVLCFNKAKQKKINNNGRRGILAYRKESVSEQAPAEARLGDCRRNGH